MTLNCHAPDISGTAMCQKYLALCQKIANRMHWLLALEIFYTWHTVYLGGGSTCFGLQHGTSRGWRL